MLVLGITPGPEMLSGGQDLIWFLVSVLVIANIVGAAILYPVSGYLGKLAYLRCGMLIGPILILAAAGTFMMRGQWQSMVLAFLFGLLGYGMKIWGYPRAPIILGFILGPLAENYLNRAVGTMGPEFLQRPIVLVLLILSIASIGYSLIQEYGKPKSTNEDMA